VSLERVNEIHGEAFRRADGDREVALSILAQRIDLLEGTMQAFLDTMGFRMSGIYEREVPQGFSRLSGPAAVQMFDRLQEGL
jgi:hypothetical protein